MGRPQRKAKSQYKSTQKTAQKEKQKQEVEAEKYQKQKQPKTQKKKQENQERAEPEEKTKPIVKAKKYKKKSHEQQARIHRSKVERIYLISANRNQGNWNFVVQGSSGKQYYVSVSTYVSCSCMDFLFKKIPCKHIYFIVTQVGQNDELLDFFKKDRRISANAYKILDEQLTNRLKSRLQKPAKDSKDIDLKDQTDCVICFTQMDKQTQPLQDCSTCKKYFHTQCISAWKTHNASCPLCRGSLAAVISKDGLDTNDPLSKVMGIKL